MLTIKEIVARLEEAHYAYHNGLPETMSDDQYDELKDQLEALDPSNPFLTKIGAPITAGDEVALPIPLPSLNKAKPADLGKWLAKNPAETYMVSAKLDGCSALWLPASKGLFTRGDGTKGRNISAFAPYFKGLPATTVVEAIRGELIMRTDSTAVPEGKLARNIVAGVLNRKEIDPTLFGEIHFVAYELIEPATMVPMDSNRLLKSAGFETARATLVKAADMNETQLSAIFDAAEKVNPYQMDGIVVAPNVARATRPHGLANPTDRVAWKQRGSVQSRRTTVREVDWNISASGFLIPRVLFDEVEVGGAKIHAATGLHGRWIHDNAVGPGAIIEIRRAGDTIPQIIAVHSPAPAGPSMPPGFEWVGTAEAGVHIRPSAEANTTDLRKIRVVHALGELGAEHVGPGVVAKLFAAGFNSVGTIYAATPADFAARVEGCKGKMASKIFDGLRAAEAKWTELDFLAASSTMPRTVGRTKLGALLLIDPKPARWNTSLPGKTIPGISADTVTQVIAALPAYSTWRAENLAWIPEASSNTSGVPTGPTVAPSGRVFVFTGFRDKDLEAALAARGDVLANTVSKKTTAVVYPDGPVQTSSKVTKAQELNVPVLNLSAFRAKYLHA